MTRRTSPSLNQIRVDVESLVPEAYAQFRQLVAEALVFFVEQLPSDHRHAIAAALFRLPPDASPAFRVATVMACSPVLHKLAQIIARQKNLDTELSTRLARLESLEPVTAVADVRADIARVLEATTDGSVTVADTPLAEASVAVVVPFTWRATDPAVDGVFKVLKPGVETRLDAELAILEALGAFLDDRSAELHLPAFEFAETFAQVPELLANEVQLRREQSHLNEAAQAFRHSPNVQIPQLLPFCSNRVTSMERVYGCKVTEGLSSRAGVGHRLVRSISEACIIQPMWSGDDDAIFHGDPHAGNLFQTQDDKLAMLDWSLAGRLSKQSRCDLTQCMLGVVSASSPAVCEAVVRLSRTAPDESRLRSTVDSFLSARQRAVPGFTLFVQLLDAVAAVAGVRFESDLLVFRKSMLLVTGLLNEFVSDTTLDDLVWGEAILRLASEWPMRWIQPPTSRAFRSHLSTLDLWQAAATVPALGHRWWQNQFRT